MKILYLKGDLLKSDESVIAHGCNAQGVMRSGIAKSIREMYPQVYLDYLNAYIEQDHSLSLGQVIRTDTVRKVSDRTGAVITVLSAITQEFYGRDKNVVYVSYEAIERAVINMNELGFLRIAMPLIGAGLANGDWEIISKVIEKTSTFRPVVYIL